MMKRIVLIILISFSFLHAGKWLNGPFLNESRAGAAAVNWDGKIYVFGGKSLNNSVLNTVEVYDPDAGHWDSTLVPHFEYNRYNASAIVWQNKIYLIGGRTNDEVLKCVEVYDPVQNTWAEAQELRKEREGHSTRIFNNRIYAIGGQREDFQLVEEIEWYDDQEEKWEDAIFDLPYPRVAHFTEVYNNEFYMFGGYYWGLTSNIYKAFPDTLGYSFIEIGSLSEPRAYGVTAKLDSLIYIIGGETESGKTKNVEIYDAKNNIIYSGESMQMAHSGMACAVLNGKIYVIGGFEDSENDAINHVHVYEPTVTSLADPIIKPEHYIIANAYPNPFNGQVKIDISIPFNDRVNIEILNTVGQRIRKLADSELLSGKYSYFWDARDNTGSYVASALYFISITTQRQNQLLKITYVK